MLSVIMLSVIMLSVIMLSVIMLNVMALLSVLLMPLCVSILIGTTFLKVLPSYFSFLSREPLLKWKAPYI
jgi:hypothetical protein